jgi:hypothetical protein
VKSVGDVWPTRLKQKPVGGFFHYGATGAAANAHAPERVENLEKAADIRDLLQDNEIVSWFWHLTDVLLPILTTNMNIFSKLPSPCRTNFSKKCGGP